MVERAWTQLIDVLKKVRAWTVENPLAFFLFLIGLVIFFVILAETIRQGNTGFSVKPLWEWMDLLLVPAALAIAGYSLASIQKKTEVKLAEQERKADRAIADEKRRQQTFENYIDRMSTLLLEKALGADARPEVLRLARTLTLNVLRELLAERNKQVTQFLQESDLLGKNGVITLSKADLEGANLEWTNLRGADLRGAFLSVADLRGADLSDANLEGATLHGADLRGADLRGAFLSDASLEWADLRGAFLAKCSHNEETIWPDDFDPNTIRFPDPF